MRSFFINCLRFFKYLVPGFYRKTDPLLKQLEITDQYLKIQNLRRLEEELFRKIILKTDLHVIPPLAIVIILACFQPAYASNSVSLYSGTFEGEHPNPVLISKVSRGDQFIIEMPRVSALVNYADPQKPIILERVVKPEVGAVVTCPWFMKIEESGFGTQINENHVSKINHKVFCQNDGGDGGCKDLFGRSIPKSELLFGKFNLLKVKAKSGEDLGFLDLHDKYPIYCPEFSVERIFSELHYFDRLLIIDNFREQELDDLDIDFRKIYLTFENEKLDCATCAISDLIIFGDTFKVADLKDCVLPPGEHFVMYAQSRFFLKDTRPCGKIVAHGIKTEEGYVADWFTGWYECDGKADRSPIEKQYTYATRLELKLTNSNIGGN